MAKNWMAYEAAKAIYGKNEEDITDVGSRYPLFARAVAMIDNEHVLDLLSALPKVTARVIETGMKCLPEDSEDSEDSECLKETKEEKKAPAKPEAKTAPKTKHTKEHEDEDETEEYEEMTAKNLYKLCCDRGISSQCKKRDKASLIAVLESNKGAESDEDEWSEEEEKEVYTGKSAKELYKMCTDRDIKTKPKLTADAYAKLLKKDDETEDDAQDEEEDDWEI